MAYSTSHVKHVHVLRLDSLGVDHVCTVPFIERISLLNVCEVFLIGRNWNDRSSLYCWMLHFFCRIRAQGGAAKRKKLLTQSFFKFRCSVDTMSHFESNSGELWLSCSDPLDYSSSCQFLSAVGASPATPIEYLLDSDGDIFSDMMDDSFCQEPWLELPPLNEDCEDLEENHLIPDADQSKYGAIVNVFKIPASTAPPALSRSASVRCRWPNFVWLICACNRFSHAAAASLRAKVPQARNMLKGVMKKKDKYVCEMRVMRKMQKEKNKLIEKVWLGTYKSEAQAARALDVGKYFFNSKEGKSFFDPNSETVLSQLSYLLAQPLEELVKNVKKLAKDYGENGSVQNFVL